MGQTLSRRPSRLRVTLRVAFGERLVNGVAVVVELALGQFRGADVPEQRERRHQNHSNDHRPFERHLFHLIDGVAKEAVRLGERVRVTQGSGSTVLAARADASLAEGTVRIAAGHPATVALGAMFGTVTVEKA